MSRLIVYAPNVCVGGGLVLLKTLVRGWPDDLNFFAFLDQRISGSLVLPRNSKIHWVKPTIWGRISAELTLFKASTHKDVILHKNSLPPLLKSKGKTVLFMQNVLLIASGELSGYPLRQALRLRIERLICYVFRRRVDEYIVQTNSVKISLEDWYKHRNPYDKPKITVFPFMENIKETKKKCKKERFNFDFIFVADGLAHKNHATLFAAWTELADEGISPVLAVTVHPSDTELAAQVEILKKGGIDLINIGWLPHHELLQKYFESKALIYPSLYESFGMPLVEASALGLPILASEMDYVYDVCDPAGTFDPRSSRSIARAVKKHLGVKHSYEIIRSSESFVQYLVELKTNGQ